MTLRSLASQMFELRNIVSDVQLVEGFIAYEKLIVIQMLQRKFQILGQRPQLVLWVLLTLVTKLFNP